MGSALGEIAPLAAGVAISPFPIIAVILILLTARARGNGLALLFGWVLGPAVTMAVVLLLLHPHDLDERGTSRVSGALELTIGAILLVVAQRRWATRPAPGEVAPRPRWMRRLDGIGLRGAVTAGTLLFVVNPKNVALTVGAAAGLSRLGRDATTTTVSATVFVLLTAVPIAVPWLYYVLAPERAAGVIRRWHQELELHRTAVAISLLLVFGVLFISNGVSTLTDPGS